ncbi:MAG: hypothetical protein E6G66_03070 [Actinobacteria bacterium]|nr:MAG: hypothetical protein E6G66_03070 [Actinomycetota bacterium]
MIRRRSAMATAGAIGLTLTASVGAIAANTGLLGRASSAGRVGQLSALSVPVTSAKTAPSSTPITVHADPPAGIDIPQPPAPTGDPAPTAAAPETTATTHSATARHVAPAPSATPGGQAISRPASSPSPVPLYPGPAPSPAPTPTAGTPGPTPTPTPTPTSTAKPRDRHPVAPSPNPSPTPRGDD